MLPNFETRSEFVDYVFIYHLYFSWTNCNDIPLCDTASNYDIVFNSLQISDSHTSAGIDVTNLLRFIVAKENAATELNTLNTLLCLSKKKQSGLGIVFVTDLNRAWTFGTKGGVSLAPSG